MASSFSSFHESISFSQKYPEMIFMINLPMIYIVYIYISSLILIQYIPSFNYFPRKYAQVYSQYILDREVNYFMIYSMFASYSHEISPNYIPQVPSSSHLHPACHLQTHSPASWPFTILCRSRPFTPHWVQAPRPEPTTRCSSPQAQPESNASS